MSLAEKATQLEALGSEAGKNPLFNFQAMMQACEDVGSAAAGIIGDLPAGQSAMDAWNSARQQVETAGVAVQGAILKLSEIAQAVRQAGQAR